MKTTLFSVTALLASVLLALAEAEVGKPAPAFEVKDINGKTQKLGGYKGKIVVIESYNLDCPYVVKHYKAGAMQDLQAELTGKGVIWLTVNTNYEEAERAKKEFASQKMKVTALLHDPAGVIGKAYGFKTTPHLFVINKDGVVAYAGAIDDKPGTDANPREAKNHVREAVNELLAGKAVSVTKSKPYGCGIKYASK
jgi:peroxiredoxin